LIPRGLIAAGWPLREKIITISTFVTCCLLSLRLGGASQRYWARGGVSDTVAMLGWLGCGIGLSGALVTVFLQDIKYWVAICHLSAAPLVVAGLLAPRVLAVVLRESAVVAHHRRGGKSRPEAKRTLLYGAGNLGELFVFWLGISRESEWSDLAVVGFIDDQEALKGRQIRGFPVLGGLVELEKLVARHRVDCVVVTMSRPQKGCMERLAAMAAALDVEVFEWRPEMGMLPHVEAKGIVQVSVETAVDGN
jgi:O-antigen biosynthesis protein WbqV